MGKQDGSRGIVLLAEVLRPRPCYKLPAGSNTDDHALNTHTQGWVCLFPPSAASTRLAFQTGVFRYAEVVHFTKLISGLPFVLPTLLSLITTQPNTRIMKQTISLIIAALASAATVSAQTPSYQGALVISRVSPPLSITPRGLLKDMHSLRKQRKVPDIPKRVSTLSPFIQHMCHHLAFAPLVSSKK